MSSLFQKFYLNLDKKGLFNTARITFFFIIKKIIFLFRFLNNYKLFRLINYKINPKYIHHSIFNILNKESIFIDLGANIGDTTQYIHDVYDCKIFAYEPNNDAFNILKKKFKYKKKIKLINSAVLNYNGKSNLYLHKLSTIHNGTEFSQASSLNIKKNNIDKKKKQNCTVIHINKILKKFKKRIILKIDIEGSEYKILPFLLKNQNNIERVACEMHKGAFKKEYNKFYNFLKNKKLLNKWFFLWY